MAVSNGCQPWLTAMTVSHGCQKWLSAMVVSHGCQPWLSAMAVSHGCQQWLSVQSQQETFLSQSLEKNTFFARPGPLGVRLGQKKDGTR